MAAPVERGAGQWRSFRLVLRKGDAGERVSRGSRPKHFELAVQSTLVKLFTTAPW